MKIHWNAGRGKAHVAHRLAEYFSGSLKPADEFAVESHLLSCAACRAEYAELGEVAVLLALLAQGRLGD